MRCTQIIGLNDKAFQFLEQNQVKELVRCNCPDCKTEHIQGTKSDQYNDARNEGMFDDGPMLYKYHLKDGSFVYEYVQASPWSSGPCIFLALSMSPLNENNNPIIESLWSDEEIENA